MSFPENILARESWTGAQTTASIAARTNLVFLSRFQRVLQVAGDRYRSQANQNRYRLIQTDALRGIIYDRAGKIVVRNIPSFNVSIVPADLDEADEERVFKDLSTLLGVPIETVIENTSEDVAGTLPADLERNVTPPKRKPGIREL
jgi:cell division protein FtsI/penicillin-binding protein 2